MGVWWATAANSVRRDYKRIPRFGSLAGQVFLTVTITLLFGGLTVVISQEIESLSLLQRIELWFVAYLCIAIGTYVLLAAAAKFVLRGEQRRIKRALDDLRLADFTEGDIGYFANIWAGTINTGIPVGNIKYKRLKAATKNRIPVIRFEDGINLSDGKKILVPIISLDSFEKYLRECGEV